MRGSGVLGQPGIDREEAWSEEIEREEEERSWSGRRKEGPYSLPCILKYSW